MSAYLESVAPSPTNTAGQREAHFTPSQHAQNQASETLTSSLMDQVQAIMRRAEAEGTDPDSELREVVGRHVLEGVLTGYEMTARGEEGEGREQREEGEVKRSRTDDGPGPGPAV